MNISIDSLKLCQIYLSQKKIDDILAWFQLSMKNFEPIYVHDFMKDGNFHITDGHTRAFIAWKYGIKQIPYIYDESKIVTSEMGQIQYEEDIAWCIDSIFITYQTYQTEYCQNRAITNFGVGDATKCMI